MSIKNYSIDAKREMIKTVLRETLLNKDRELEPNYQYANSIDRFPELVLLNIHHNSQHKRPIFWFHSVGGVQPYHLIAKITNRPFYGIESRGWRTERYPLHGIQAVAAYYLSIIKAVQPIGPYDLGGYSLGGLVGYEVTRQLQELGDSVSTMVMLDTLGPNVLESTKEVSFKSRLLQAANFILAARLLDNTQNIKSILIKNSEVDWSQSEEQITIKLQYLIRERGMRQSTEELKSLIKKWAHIQVAYDYANYKIYPLERPNEIQCYFFRNSSGLFFGDLAECYTIPEDNITVDKINYWALWESLFDNIEIIDVDSSNHMMLLSEPSAYQKIVSYCEKIYYTVS